MFNITVFNNETLLKTTLNKSNKIDLGYRTGVFRGGLKINVSSTEIQFAQLRTILHLRERLSGSGFIIIYRYKAISIIVLCDFKLKQRPNNVQY